MRKHKKPKISIYTRNFSDPVLDSALFCYSSLNMCGRFCCALNQASVTTELSEHAICQDILWKDKEKYVPSYNLCPTRYVLALYQDDVSKQKVLQPMVPIHVKVYVLTLILSFFISNGVSFLLGPKIVPWLE